MMKLKSVLSLLLTAALLLSVCFSTTVVVSAETENSIIFTLSDEGATVTGTERTAPDDLVIPATLGGKPVVAIGERAFFQNRFTSITLPDTVTLIEGSAFGYSYELESIELPDGLLEIGARAFHGCEKLESVVVPDSVTEIGDDAFAYCDVLTTANLPASLTKMGESIFASCPKLTSAMTIPEGITEIPAGSFYGCKKLSGVTFHEGVTAVHNEAFMNCDALTQLVLPMSLVDLGYHAFRGCDSLAEVTIGDQVEYNFLADPLSSCPIKILHIAEGSTVVHDGIVGYVGGAIETVTIPESVTEIGESAFLNCDALESLVLPESITTIGKGAFRGCDELGEIVIPDSVTKIGDNILTDTRLSLTASSWTDGVLYVGNHLIEVDPKFEGELIVRDGTVNIATGAFDDCSKLTGLHLPASLKNINDEAFSSSNYNLNAVEFDGNQEDWKKVTIGKSNSQLTDKKLIYKTGGSYGDVNIDGQVNAADALEVLKNAVGKTKFDLRALTVANVDLSNKIDAADALMILQKAVSKIEIFPAEKVGLRMNTNYRGIVLTQNQDINLHVVEINLQSETEIECAIFGYTSDASVYDDPVPEYISRVVHKGITYYEITGKGGLYSCTVDGDKITVSATIEGTTKEIGRLQIQDNGEMLCVSGDGEYFSDGMIFRVA